MEGKKTTQILALVNGDTTTHATLDFNIAENCRCSQNLDLQSCQC